MGLLLKRFPFSMGMFKCHAKPWLPHKFDVIVARLEFMCYPFPFTRERRKLYSSSVEFKPVFHMLPSSCTMVRITWDFPDSVPDKFELVPTTNGSRKHFPLHLHKACDLHANVLFSERVV